MTIQLEKEEMLESFERFEIPLDELILDPICFMKKEYLNGTIELAKSEEINALWIPEHQLEDRYLIDTLLTWEPERATEWFPWIHSLEFKDNIDRLRRTEKLRLFRTPEIKYPFRELLAKIEAENKIGAIMCAEILSFSFESEKVILLPELGLTDVLKRSRKSLLRFFNNVQNKKLQFFESVVGKEKMIRTKSLRWIIGGSLAMASIFVGPIGFAGIGLWVLDP